MTSRTSSKSASSGGPRRSRSSSVSRAARPPRASSSSPADLLIDNWPAIIEVAERSFPELFQAVRSAQLYRAGADVVVVALETDEAFALANTERNSFILRGLILWVADSGAKAQFMRLREVEMGLLIAATAQP
jgi:hypothetical protein